VVLLSQDLANARFDLVAIDVQDGIRQATAHLAGTGRRRIAYVGGPEAGRISRAKHAGYLRALAEHGLAADPGLRLAGDFSLGTGYAAAHRFLRQAAAPDAIVAENDLLAIGCLKYLLQQGIPVPGAVAVSGFDNISLAAMYEPALTTVAIPIDRMAAEALAMLTRPRPAAGAEHCRSIHRLELLVRASSGAAQIPPQVRQVRP